MAAHPDIPAMPAADVETSASPEDPAAARRATLGGKVRRRIKEAVARRRTAIERAPRDFRDANLEVLQKLAWNDPAKALRLFRAARRIGRGSAFFAQAEALLTARMAGWAAAAPLFLRQRAAPDGSALVFLRAAETPPGDLATPPQTRPPGPSPDILADVAVYTAVFGDQTPPQPINAPLLGLAPICFTDRDALEIPGWRVVRIAPPQEGAARSAAWCRIMPGELLSAAAPEAKWSLYVGPERWLIGNLNTLLLRWCLSNDFAMMRHEGGVDWRDLIERALLAGSDVETDRLLAQARMCEAQGAPRDRGAFDTGLIWRRHGDARIAELMSAWWSEHVAEPGIEAVSLYLALNDPARRRPEPRLFPAHLGTASDNAFTLRRPGVEPVKRRAANEPAHGGKTPITLVYHPDHATSATTELRIRQFGDLLARRYADRFEIDSASATADLSGRVLVLFKEAIRRETPESLDALRRRNLALISSWEDSLPVVALMERFDADMPVSYRQARDHQKLFPRTPSFLVGHHVNVLIPPMTAPADRFRAGYFGHHENTHLPASARRLVDLVALDVRKLNMSWIERLPEYNCHWMVRRYRNVDAGGKPFLKGFVAARCGAVVVAGAGDDDAVQYLGDDYPFFVHGTEPGDLERRAVEVAASFGGPDWRFAQEIMRQVAARSTDDVFCEEFRQMIEGVLA